LARMQKQNQEVDFGAGEDNKNELETEIKEKDNKINLLQQTLQGLQKQLLELHHKGGALGDSDKMKKETTPLPGNDSKLVAIVSTFLVSHPYAVSTEAVWNHVNTIDSSVQLQKVEKVLGEYKDCFNCVSIDEEPVKKWKLVALQSS